MSDYKKLSNKRVLITGGAGFIGSNLCESFLESGNEVICLDNLSTGFKANLNSLLDHPDFDFVEGDIRNYNTCKELLGKVDVVLHQAALGSVPRSINDPITSNQVNVDGFLNILQAARETGVERVVYAASSSTYGDSTDLPKVEENIGMPISPYAVTKYVNELYAHVFSNLFGLKIIGLRYFNVFGRKQTPDGAYAAAIPKFIKAFMNHESPIIHGDGLQTRDFTYIDNVVQINHLAAGTINAEAFNNVYNVAYGERTSLMDLIDVIRDSLSKFDPEISNVEVEHGPPREGDVRDSLADVSKAKSLLGYKPEYSLKDGIREAIDWYWQSLK